MDTPHTRTRTPTHPHTHIHPQAQGITDPWWQASSDNAIGAGMGGRTAWQGQPLFPCSLNGWVVCDAGSNLNRGLFGPACCGKTSREPGPSRAGPKSRIGLPSDRASLLCSGCWDKRALGWVERDKRAVGAVPASLCCRLHANAKERVRGSGTLMSPAMSRCRGSKGGEHCAAAAAPSQRVSRR